MLLNLVGTSSVFLYIVSWFWLQRVLLNFERFDVGEKNYCSKDNVSVTDSVSGKQLGTFCGDDPPGDVISSSNRLSVVFRTDDSGTHTGFVIKYRARRMIHGRRMWVV